MSKGRVGNDARVVHGRIHTRKSKITLSCEVVESGELIGKTDKEWLERVGEKKVENPQRESGESGLHL